jgi:hypothetical protein
LQQLLLSWGLQEQAVVAVLWRVGVLLVLQDRLQGCWPLWGSLHLVLLLQAVLVAAAEQQRQQQQSRRQMRRKLLQL